MDAANGGRARQFALDGDTFTVLVPPDYETSGVRYPVLYLIHGGLGTDTTWLRLTRIYDFTEGFRGDRGVIVVMLNGDPNGVWKDWADGRFRPETFTINTLIPFIDENFRTNAARTHRAFGGLSGGSLGAFRFAARHPELVGVAAGFLNGAGLSLVAGDSPASGTVNAAALAGLFFGVNVCAGNADPLVACPDPMAQTVCWYNFDAGQWPRNLSATDVAFYSGNGIPCDQEEAATLADNPLRLGEPAIRQISRRFDAALSEAGVEHRYREMECGIHSYQSVQRQLEDWWPSMMAAFDNPQPAPAVFDFRSADARFSAWGWTFETAPDRAPEFLEVNDASDRGVTLTGSGIVAVETAPQFSPNEAVIVRGAREAVVTATNDGRIRFTVDLGPAHTLPQYSIPQHIVEAAGGYWVSKRLSFVRA